MRASRIILIVSLAGNLALWAAFRWTQTFEIITADPAVASPLATPPGGRGDVIASPMPAPADGREDNAFAADGVPSARSGNSWAELRSDDLPVYVARLRAAGFPPHVVRAIITSAVNERFASQRQQLMASDAETPFWKPTPGIFNDPDKLATFNQLNRDRDTLLQQLLGGEAAPEDELMRVYHQRQYGELAPDKLQRLQAVLADYGDLRMQLRPPNRPMTPDDAQKLAAFEREFRADLAKLLTPEELEQYDLRSSATATHLRQRLDVFQPSENEYKALFSLYRTLDEQFPTSTMPMTPQQAAARRAAEERIQSQVKAALGPERYADFQQATNPSHTALNQLVARFDLPLSAARDVVAVQQSISSRAKEVLTSDTLTPEQQTAQLQALSREATARISATLTPRGLQAYQQHGGQWLQTLTRPVGVPSP